MKCPTCNAWASVKDTRQRVGSTYRRYVCANEHRFSTTEEVVKFQQTGRTGWQQIKESA
jgi:transcriptional regulator NrdR family protein